MPDPAPILQYHRPKHRPAQFTARFVTIATLGLIVTVPFLLLNLFTFAAIIVAMVKRPEEVASPGSMIFFTILRISLDLALIAGSILTYSRSKWARRLIIPAAVLELMELLVVPSFRAAEFGVASLPVPLYPTLTTLGLAVLRAGVAGALFFVNRSIHADFYFSTDPNATPGAVGEPHEVHAIGSAGSAPTFVIRGIDQTTGMPIEFDSHAPTIELARDSALGLGLDPDSIQIERPT